MMLLNGQNNVVMNKTKEEKLYKAACERYKMLRHLSEACNICRMCNLGWSKASRSGYEYDPHVFSNYDPMVGPSKFMIVGQNPGWNEVKKGEPFVGQAGSNFDKELDKLLWSRKDFYITNTVKCYTQNNKPPESKHIKRCEPFLRMEIAIIKPVLIIAFGAVAFNILCDDEKFSDNIGKITRSDKFGVKVFTTYHPSPLNLADLDRRKRFRKDIAMLGKIMNYYLTPF